jgi:hypothetical protein
MAELPSNVGKVTASLDEDAGERPTQIVEAKLALTLGLVELGLVRFGGTFNGLVRDYTLSPEFENLRESTQREYRRMLTKAELQFGNLAYYIKSRRNTYWSRTRRFLRSN